MPQLQQQSSLLCVDEIKKSFFSIILEVKSFENRVFLLCCRVSPLFYLIMIMTKPSHSSAVISFYSTMLREAGNVLAPRSPWRTAMSCPLGGPQTSGKMRESQGTETMQQRNLHLFVSVQPWSVLLTVTALIAWQGCFTAMPSTY